MKTNGEHSEDTWVSGAESFANKFRDKIAKTVPDKHGRYHIHTL